MGKRRSISLKTRAPDSYEAEWLEFSKKSLKIGIIRAGLPLWLVFGIADYLYAPEKLALLLTVRICVVCLSTVYLWYALRAETKRSFTLRYVGLLAFYGLAILFVTYLVGDPHNTYFLGEFLVAIGAFTFVILPFGYYVLVALIIFVPILVYAIITHMAQEYPYSFTVFSFTSIGIIWVCGHVRSYLEVTRAQEFEARQALRQILADKEVAVQKLADQVCSLGALNEGQDQRNVEKVARQVAHDIRSPLSAMNAIAKKVEHISPELADLLKMSSKRINDIADSLSAPLLKKCDTGQVTEVKEAISTVVKEKLLRVNRDRIQMKVDVSQDLPRLPISPSNFERVISNITENAIEAINGSGVIEIRAQKARSNGSVAQIEIRDNGCGISPENLKKIGHYGFTHGKAKGSGLGLAYAREVIESVSGKIKVSSEIGKYTSVVVEIPTASSVGPLGALRLQ